MSKTQYAEGQTQHFGTLNPDKNYYISESQIDISKLGFFFTDFQLVFDSTERKNCSGIDECLASQANAEASCPRSSRRRDFLIFIIQIQESGGYKSQTHLPGWQLPIWRHFCGIKNAKHTVSSDQQITFLDECTTCWNYDKHWSC